MKNILLLFPFLFTICFCYSQEEYKYKRIYEYDDYREDWALAKTEKQMGKNYYGFVNKEGKTVVAPIYTKIGKFTINSGKYAKVKTALRTYGLIDRNGKLVVEAGYKKIGKFGEYADDIALVKSITETYGFINRNGKEIVEPVYTLKELKQNYHEVIDQ